MAKLLPFFDVGIDPRDGREFCLLSLSGARQLREVLDKAIGLISDGLAENPEKDTDVCKLEVECGKVHVVFMTDNTLDKIMGLAKNMAGLPDTFNPWKDKKGQDFNTEIPDWLMQLAPGVDGPDEDVENLRRLLNEEPDPLD